MKLADEVAALAVKTAKTPSTAVASASGGAGSAKAPSEAAVGFNDQEFEPSPLDELSKLELTPDEQQIDNNPVAQQQYQYIQYAVANKSLGFSLSGPSDDPAVHQLLSRPRPHDDGGRALPLGNVHADGPPDL